MPENYVQLLAERDALREQLMRINPGHFYSPIPSMEYVHKNSAQIFDRSLRDLPGVDIDADGQLRLLDKLKIFYSEQPFAKDPQPGLRFYFQNDFYSYSDAIFLYSMMRHAQPKRIIEIGSGFSSFVMLDTNEKFFDNSIKLTFIDPSDERLRTRLKSSDWNSTRIITKPVQEVNLNIFDELEPGDILFIDSSHVSKAGSDVNHILFSILPRLANGILIHFHDMFYPFEYPREWIEGGASLNEDYFLRAFLQYNSAFKIRIWNQFLGLHFSERLRQSMPLCMQNIGGSLWLQRICA